VDPSIDVCSICIVIPILLHGAETWVLTQSLLCMLQSFHHRCARYLAHMINTQNNDGTWIITPFQAARNAASLLTIKEYVQRPVDTFLPFIRSHDVYWECQDSCANQAALNHPIWWAAHAPLPALLAPPQAQQNADEHQPASAAPFPFLAPH